MERSFFNRPQSRLALALWLLLLLFWPNVSDPPQEWDQVKGESSSEDLYRASLTHASFGLAGVKFYESVQGKPRWKIDSQFAEMHQKENYIFLKNILATFFSASETNQVFTRSDYGRSWTDKNTIELEGNVQVESQKGYLFQVKRLNYDGNRHELSSKEAVEMKGPNVNHPEMVLRGHGLRAQVDKERFILEQNVSSVKRLKTGEWLKIWSKTGEFFTGDSRAIFQGLVHSQMPGIQMESDMFEISSLEGKENVQALGNVKLVSKDRFGYAQKASLEIGGNEIILEGKARIEAQGNVIRGKSIRIFTDDDKIVVQEAEGKIHRDTSH